MEPDAFDEETFFRAIQAWAERRQAEPLSVEEFTALLAIPVTSAEVAEVTELVNWFQRRYPTAAIGLPTSGVHGRDG